VKVSKRAALVVLTLTSTAHADVGERCATDAERATDDREAGRVRAAIDGFTRCSRDVCPRVVRMDCREALAAVRESAPRLIARVRDRNGDLPRASVAIDGDPLTSDDLVHGRVVDPGSHRLRATLEGYAPLERDVVVTISDRAKVVDLVMTEAARKTTWMPRRDRTAAYVVGGVGVGLVTAFGVLGTFTYLDYRALERQCGPRCPEGDLEGPRTRGLLADIALGAGVLALGLATILWVTAPERR
jgi:hypothetical protein